ncbi:MAG: 3D domain-containing protein [Clostridiales bacterium]
MDNKAIIYKYQPIVGISLAILFFFVLAVFLGGASFGEKEVTLIIDGQSKLYQTQQNTVADFLEEQGIILDPCDNIDLDKDARLKDQQIIKITRSFDVIVVADSKEIKVRTVPLTVRGILEKADIEVGNMDKVSLPMDKLIQKSQTIWVSRVELKYFNEKVKVAVPVEKRQDASLPKGTTKVIKEGKAGLQEINWQYVIKNGQVAGKTKVSSKMLQAPQKKIVAYGTKALASRSGDPFNTRNAVAADLAAKKTVVVRATAYTHTGNRTRTGTWPKEGTIAVDPSVIPLGSYLYVEGYGYGRAEDTGGAIKGNRIDVFMDSEGACRQWGVKKVDVYVLD